MARSRRRARGGGSRRERRIGLRLLVWAGVLLLFGGVAFSFGGYLWLKGYLKSEKFRAFIARTTSDALNAEGQYEPFQWTGTSVYSDVYRAQGRAGAGFSKLKASGIRADINLGAARDGVWEIRRIDILQLNILVDDDRPAANAPSGGGVEQADGGTGGGGGGSGGGIFRSMIPNRVEILETSVNEANLVVAGDVPLELRGAQLTVRPTSNEQVFGIRGVGGSLKVAGLPECDLDDFSVRSGNGKLFIDGATMEFLDEARLSLSGELDFGDSVGMRLGGRVKGLAAEDVLSPDWRQKLKGEIYGTVDVTRDPVEGASVVYSGDLRIRDGILEALPILEKIENYTRVTSFRKLVLSKARAKFEKRGDILRVEELEIVSNGLIRVEGKLTVVGENLAGDFQVGVTPGTLKWIPGAEQKVFTRRADGYVWTSMRLAGTKQAPVEDLSARLKAAAVEATVEAVAEVPIRAVETVVGEGTGDGARDVLKTGVDVGTGLLDGIAGGAVRSGGDLLKGVMTPLLGN